MKTIIARDIVLMCKKHGKPIVPSNIKIGCKHVGCSKCKKEYRLKGRPARAKEWEEHYKRNCHCNICSCCRHPKRRCNKSAYVSNIARHCWYCYFRRKDGTVYPAHIKNQHWNNLRQKAKKAIRRREFLLTMGFEPLTGGNIHSV